MNTIAYILSLVIKELFDYELNSVIVSRPDARFGDFASNVALQLAKPMGKNPRELAEQIVATLQDHPSIAEASVAGPEMGTGSSALAMRKLATNDLTDVTFTQAGSDQVSLLVARFTGTFN